MLDDLRSPWPATTALFNVFRYLTFPVGSWRR